MPKRLPMEVNLVAATKLMRFTEDESLTYLKANGYPMSRVKYRKIQREIEESTMHRLYSIAREFPRHHLERIETINEIERQLWKACHSVGPEQRLGFLKQLLELQPYLSAYIEATPKVMQLSEDEKRNAIEVQR